MTKYPEHRRLAVFSQFFPPVRNGNAISLGNFLQYLDPNKIIGFTRKHHLYHKNDPTAALGCKVVDIEPKMPVMLEKSLIRLGSVSSAKIPFLPYSASKAVWHAKNFGAEAVLATFGHYYFTTAYAVSKILDIDLYLLVFDPLDFGLDSFSISSLFYSKTMQMVVDHARSVMAFNKCLAEDIYQRFGKSCEIVPQIADPELIAEYEERPLNEPMRLVFTGMVNHAHIDALRFLLRTMEKYDYPAEVWIYTTLNEEFFHRHGIPTNKVRLSLVPKSEVSNVQRNADVLLLFSSFEYPQSWEPVIRTMYPTKVVEYYSAARPILLVGNPKACITRYAREYESMVVIDEPDERLLLDTLDRLRTSKKLVKDVISKARKALYDLHHPNVVLPRFLEIINGKI